MVSCSMTIVLHNGGVSTTASGVRRSNSKACWIRLTSLAVSSFFIKFWSSCARNSAICSFVRESGSVRSSITKFFNADSTCSFETGGSLCVWSCISLSSIVAIEIRASSVADALESPAGGVVFLSLVFFFMIVESK